MSTLQGTAYESVADKPAVRVAEGESLRHVRLGGAHQGFYARAVKPLGDRLAAVLLLLALAPVIVVLSLAVALLSGWPPWSRSKRVGLNGNEFWMLKIRTMRRDADAVLA